MGRRYRSICELYRNKRFLPQIIGDVTHDGSYAGRGGAFEGVEKALYWPNQCNVVSGDSSPQNNNFRGSFKGK